MSFAIPNTLTISRILLTPFFAYYFMQEIPEDKLVATIIFFIAAFTDWLDGYLARKLGYSTRVGQFLDPVADKILVSTALAVLAYTNYIYLWMVLIIIIRDVLLTALRIYAMQHGKVIITSSFAKWKTFFQMGYLFVILIYLNFPGLPDIKLLYSVKDYLMWSTISAAFVTLLTIASGIHYIYYNRSHIIEIFRRLTKPWFH